MTRPRQTPLLLAALVLAGVACTRQESVTPATPSPTAPTTAAAPDTTLPPPVTEPAATAAPVATTAATTTTVPPTTTPPPSGTPSSTPTQLFGGGDPDGWLYLGRWTGNAWESSLDENQ